MSNNAQILILFIMMFSVFFGLAGIISFIFEKYFPQIADWFDKWFVGLGDDWEDWDN